MQAADHCRALERRVFSARLKDIGQGVATTPPLPLMWASHVFKSPGSSAVHLCSISPCQLTFAECVDEHGCGWVGPLPGVVRTGGAAEWGFLLRSGQFPRT